jgi:hypothetical protein
VIGVTIIVASLCGLIGGFAALCIRLITPGRTFLRPPAGLPEPWERAMTYLTYVSDLVLGAIAGVVVLGVANLDSSDWIKLTSTAIIAGVGGSGFLTNLASKLQVESDHERHKGEIDDKAEDLKDRVDNLKIATPSEGAKADLTALTEGITELRSVVKSG